jgi:hypothetical protein
MSTPATRSSKLTTAAKILVPLGIAVGVGIQFIHVDGIGVNPPERAALGAPPEVEAIMKRACFDCHTNETRWPWYAKLAPGSWLMARDVRKGRARFNISEWDDDMEARAVDKESAWDEVESGEMPPWFYLPLHPDAKLSAEDKATLKAWLVPPKPEKSEKAEPAEPEKAAAAAHDAPKEAEAAAEKTTKK